MVHLAWRVKRPNNPRSVTHPAGRADCNQSAMALSSIYVIQTLSYVRFVKNAPNTAKRRASFLGSNAQCPRNLLVRVVPAKG